MRIGACADQDFGARETAAGGGGLRDKRP